MTPLRFCDYLINDALQVAWEFRVTIWAEMGLNSHQVVQPFFSPGLMAISDGVCLPGDGYHDILILFVAL